MLQNLERRFQMLVFSRFLRYFCVVAKAGSIRKASEQLNVSASSIDRQILNAEEELDIQLFERLPTGLRLTAAGELLLNSAQKWQKDFENVKMQMDDLLGLRRGHVQIAIIEALSKGLIPDVICNVRNEYPGFSFTLNVLDNVDIARALVSGEMDFGIMLNPQLSKDITLRAALNIDLGVVTSIDHPLTTKTHIRFDECVEYPMIMPSEPLALAEQVRNLVASMDANLNIAAASDNVQMIKSLIQKKLGVGILSWLDVVNEVNNKELAFIKLNNTLLKSLTLSLCVATSRQLSMAASLMLKKLETSFSGLERNTELSPDK